jgi:hypothetical protein
MRRPNRAQTLVLRGAVMSQDWRSQLNNAFAKKQQQDVKQQTQEQIAAEKAARFYQTIVAPALQELKPEFEKHGREVAVFTNDQLASIRIEFQGNEEFYLEIKQRGLYAYPLEYLRDGGKAEGYFRSGTQDYTLDDITKEELQQYIVNDYKTTMRL